MNQLLVFCRPGFENECGRELTDVAAWQGVFGFFHARPGDGYLRFSLPGPETPADLMARVPLADLVFARDWCQWLADVPLPDTDRVGAVLAALRQHRQALPACQRVEVRIPEANTDRDLGNFARKWVAPLARALRDAGLLVEGAEPSRYRLEVMLPDFQTALLGVSDARNRSPFSAGIPRLRLPADAPSRSALKLEEAWKVFLTPERAEDVLAGGRKAVDLGAAPGGWTYQLVRQGMLVSAIDNGPMDPDLMASGQVEHVRADGFRWRPQRAVDWMVCDIVDQPRKTADLAAAWFEERLCRYSIFNLKLPMKKRYEEWSSCRELIESRLQAAGIRFRLRARQLYHDREEITCFLERLD
ncbi:MAG: 23S rRNA (cytidine(2498)-2'-O)-methyltransferase RlmM [Marinobacter sp.]|uniref:23S rRNA (cytidine(2498)-2'-O)-methyltransferase RlmM n=1 Tax=Marinobacter sp. TaxID=50741 RepID=UPI00299E72BC|nr:23S rRNA (cytidine(2498)-2'-O)-methyltransferase RlmM [Marinobacter sp.]MDX1632997.1 23S rRNA (cytidine(2498)-2'-O)-methyltransferase RlmM [Marinobacter sp.]